MVHNGGRSDFKHAGTPALCKRYDHDETRCMGIQVVKVSYLFLHFHPSLLAGIVILRIAHPPAVQDHHMRSLSRHASDIPSLHWCQTSTPLHIHNGIHDQLTGKRHPCRFISSGRRLQIAMSTPMQELYYIIALIVHT